MQKTRQAIVYLTVGILLFLSVYTYFQFQEYKKYTRYVEHTYQVINGIEHLEGKLFNWVACQRGYVIAPDTMLNALVLDAHTAVRLSVDTLADLVSDNAVQVYNISQIRRLLAQTAAPSKDRLAPSESRMGTDSIKKPMLAADTRMQEIAKVLHQMKDFEARLLKVRSFFQKDTGDAIPLMLLITGLMAISLMVFAFYVMNLEVLNSTKSKEALEQNVRQLKVATDELERFAFIASHNLKEPLRKARTFISRTLPGVHSSDPIYPNLCKMELSLGRLQRMLDDLLVFSKLLHHQDTKTPVDLNQNIRLVLQEFKDEIAANKAEIILAPLPEINAYPKQVTLIFGHLLSNALKYQKIGRPLQIHVSAMLDSNSGHQVIVFSDNGIGFDKAYDQKIFEVFGRLHSQDDYEGTGIGLAICRRVMSNHHGFIQATSTLGDGATFSLYFPVAAV